MKTHEQMIQELQKAVKKSGSQQKWAAENNLSATYVSDVMRGNRAISESVANALGYEQVPMFRKKQ